MIIYSSEHKAFLLRGKNVSYAMFVNAAGYLQHLHFGGPIETADLGYLVEAVGKRVAPNPDDFNVGIATDAMPAEFGAYARGDFRDPTAVVVRGDGARMSDYRYVSHTIAAGVPNVAGLPHARRGGDTLSVTLQDDFSDLKVELNYTVWDDCDVIVRNVEYCNAGKETVTLDKAFSFCLSLPNRDYELLRLWGAWAAERIPEITPLSHGVERLQSLRGASSHQMNPFMGVLEKGCTETAGNCYGAQLIYSGSFALTAEKHNNGTVRLQGGINDFDFAWTLAAGERFVTPQAALCYSDSGLGGMSRAYHDFLRQYVLPPEHVYSRRPLVVNNWEATYFDFDNDRLIAIIDEAAALGIDTFVLDDGWFGKRDSDRSGLGDWFVNTKKLKGGLTTVIDRCKEKGLRFGLWFEPEMISEDSELYRAHPDFAVCKAGTTPVRSRNQLVLDFTRKEVVDYVYGVVHKVLSENDIDYVKWDMNRNITECFSQELPPERQGEFMHRYILGVYDLAERLTTAFPTVFFEGCASGGGRFDAGMLYYFPQFWTSDDTDAYERAKIQWGTATCYPLSAMSCHVSACPNHQTGRTMPFATRGAMASLGATGYELDLTKLTAEEKAQVKEQIAAYKRIERLVLEGDLYRLLNPFTDQGFCEMTVSKDKTAAYVVGQYILRDPPWLTFSQPIRLVGLDPHKTYRIEELDLTASGNALTNTGLAVERKRDKESWTWHITAV